MSTKSVKSDFEQHIVVLPLNVIVPQKAITPDQRKGDFYKRLAASLKHIGLIEPLIVYPRGPGDYLLLDGHVRLEILKAMVMAEAKCVLFRPMTKPIRTTGTSITYPQSHSILC